MQTIEPSTSQENLGSVPSDGTSVIQIPAPFKNTDLQLMQVHEVEPVSFQSPEIHEAEVKASDWFKSNMLELSKAYGVAIVGFAKMHDESISELEGNLEITYEKTAMSVQLEPYGDGKANSEDSWEASVLGCGTEVCVAIEDVDLKDPKEYWKSAKNSSVALLLLQMEIGNGEVMRYSIWSKKLKEDGDFKFDFDLV
ncbi:hypothetical protein HAX54_041605, partial [Datura stramonium]|nr:hypothetical protein [Datura stramonium]